MTKKPKISYRDLGKAPQAAQSPAAAQPPEPTPAAPEPTPAAATATIEAPATLAAPAAAEAPEMVLPPDIEDRAPLAPVAAPAPPTDAVPTRFRDRARARLGHAELLVFRIGPELFALQLAMVEEAIDCPPSRPLPQMPPAMRGVFMLRDGLVALYAPDVLLGLRAEEAATALVFRGSGRRVALAIDDVDDVFSLDLAELRDAPVADGGDGILVGVARRGRDLIGVLDAEALLAACRSETVLETV